MPILEFLLLLGLPLALLLLPIYLQWKLAARKALPPALRALLLFLLPAACHLGLCCLDALNRPTVSVHYFGDYFLALLYATALLFGACLGTLLALFTLLTAALRKAPLPPWNAPAAKRPTTPSTRPHQRQTAPLRVSKSTSGKNIQLRPTPPKNTTGETPSPPTEAEN